MGLHRSRRNQAAKVIADILLVIGAIIALGVILWLAGIAITSGR